MIKILFVTLLACMFSCAPIRRDYAIHTSLATTLKEVDQVCGAYDIEGFYLKDDVWHVKVVCK